MLAEDVIGRLTSYAGRVWEIWTVHWVKVERGIVSVALILLLLNKPTLTQHGLLLVYIVFWSHVVSRRGEVLAY